jgi:hypothetical protein
MAVSISVRRVSENQGRMRTNRSTTLLDTKPPRCCDTATNAAELTAGLGEKAKPKAASRTASICDVAIAPAISVGHVTRCSFRRPLNSLAFSSAE